MEEVFVTSSSSSAFVFEDKTLFLFPRTVYNLIDALEPGQLGTYVNFINIILLQVPINLQLHSFFAISSSWKFYVFGFCLFFSPSAFFFPCIKTIKTCFLAFLFGRLKNKKVTNSYVVIFCSFVWVERWEKNETLKKSFSCAGTEREKWKSCDCNRSCSSSTLKQYLRWWDKRIADKVDFVIYFEIKKKTNEIFLVALFEHRTLQGGS